MQESQDDLIGKVVLGRYRIVHNLAKGGMGIIYLARSEGAAGFAKPVVVKQILAQFSDDESVVNMFKREARIMSAMRHPGVVSVLDFGHEGNAYLMVLEYVHGFHAGRWRRYVQAKGENFPVEFAIHIIVQVLDALHYAHTLIGPDGKALRIIHRDVSPSNVLIDVDGHVKLADFGIARMQTEQTEWKTGEATVKGKLPYLAPELFRGQEPSPQTDVYAAGVVLHEMLAGRNEFRADDPSQTVAKVLQHMPTRLDALRNDVSRDIADVVARALAKRPQDRYQSAYEFAQALRNARRLSGDEAQAALAAACQRDFLDPQMPAALGCDDLTRLDRAWRNPALPPEPPAMGETSFELEPDMPSATGSVTEAEPSRTINQPPIDMPLPSVAPAPVASESGGKVRGLLFATGIFLLGAGVAAAAVVFFIAPRLHQTPTKIELSTERTMGAEFAPIALPIVDGGPEGTAAAGPELGVPSGDSPAPSNADEMAYTTTNVQDPEPSAPAGPASPSGRPVTLPTARSARPAPERPAARSSVSGNDLAATFRSHGREVERCFSDFVLEFRGVSEIRLRVKVTADGLTESTSLIPDQLTNTPFGRCLQAVAARTRWPTAGQAMIFSVPVRARSR